MASFLELYNGIEYKIKQASLRLREYSRKINELEEEVTTLKNEKEELKNSLEELKEKHNLFIITKTIAKKEDKTETKKKINDLVREIDNCIMLLNKE